MASCCRLIELALAGQPPPAALEASREEERETVPIATPPEHDTAAEPESQEQVVTARALTQEEMRLYLSVHAKQPPPRRTQRVAPQQVLRGLLDRIGSAPSLSTDVAVIDELEHLDRLSLPAETGKWEFLTPEVQQLWLSYYVARLRSAKERARDSLPAERDHVRAIVVRLHEFSARARPGHVNGMKSQHEAASGTWAEDARTLYDRLRAATSPTREPDSHARRIEPAPEAASPPPEVPIEWAHREHVREMTVVMYGGAPREDARAKLMRALGIGKLEWPESGRPRITDALVERIGNGGVDVLLLVRRFVSHTDASRLVAAARASSTRFALVDTGYGIEAMKAAIGDALRGAVNRPE